MEPVRAAGGWLQRYLKNCVLLNSAQGFRTLRPSDEDRSYGPDRAISE